jgi:hypothetical protein
MRGKIIVLLVLLSGVATGLAGLRYAFNPSPVQQRFDQRREPLAGDAPGPQVLVEQTNDFRRTAFAPLAADSDGVQRASATYVELGVRQVELRIEQVAPGQGLATLQTLQRRFERDANVSRLALFAGARTPYLYTVYAQNGRAVYEFAWINGDWLFRAFTDQADDETLLRFVNAYPF